jgi:hypothetical protein
MKAYKLTAVLWKEKEGYVSKYPELGVASAGDTVEEKRLLNCTLKMLRRLVFLKK